MNTWNHAITEHSENIRTGSDCGLLHLRGVFTKSESIAALKLLEKLRFSPQTDNNVIARYECFDILEEEFSVGVLKNLLLETKKSMSLKQDLNFEAYAFRYDAGQAIPKHKDKIRHKITAIAYFGEFEGGEYVYMKQNSSIINELKPLEGDVLISINETPEGRELNPVHWVNKVVTGIRYCIVGSLVDNNCADHSYS